MPEPEPVRVRKLTVASPEWKTSPSNKSHADPRPFVTRSPVWHKSELFEEVLAEGPPFLQGFGAGKL